MFRRQYKIERIYIYIITRFEYILLTSYDSKSLSKFQTPNQIKIILKTVYPTNKSFIQARTYVVFIVKLLHWILEEYIVPDPFLTFSMYMDSLLTSIVVRLKRCKVLFIPLMISFWENNSFKCQNMFFFSSTSAALK